MKLSFNLDAQLIADLKELENSFAYAYLKLKNCTVEEKESLHTYARVSTIGASTRIENAQLTDAEVNWIDTILTQENFVTSFSQNKQMIEDKFSKDQERSIEEVAGCREMLILIYENPQDFYPLKENDLRALHQTLLRYFQKASHYIGRYKIQSNNPNNGLEKDKKRIEI